MRITKKDRLNAEFYQMAEPKQLGDLHQRMKFAKGAMASVDFQFAFLEQFVAEARRNGRGIKPELLVPMIAMAQRRHNALRWAIFDLQREVKFSQPARPPMGQRT
jgi:hypothetical protein